MTYEESTSPFDRLMFSVRRSRRYHLYRQRFFDRLDYWSNFSTALLSSSMVVAGIVESKPWVVSVAVALTIFRFFLLAGQTTRRAMLHNSLAVEFTSLERDMVLSDGTVDQVKEFTQRRLDIETKEPPPLKILDLICHNEEVEASGYDPKYKKEIKRWQRLLAPVLDLNVHSTEIPSPGSSN